jgi:two-component system, LytTR family, response regulator
MSTLPIKTIVVDDEQFSREALIKCINDYCPEIEVVAECCSVDTAFKAINEYKPGLVFLDIEMPKGSGFDLLEMFNPPYFKVIFVTAYSTYAVQAFRCSAIDYLLKPVRVEELTDAVAKVIESNAPVSQQISVLLENLNARNQTNKKLAIFHTKGFDIIKTEEIILCEADGYCTKFYLFGEKQACSTHLIKYYEEILPKNQFMRVHNSFIVNIDHVKRYTSQGEIILSEELHCPLSLSHKAEFIKVFKTLR